MTALEPPPSLRHARIMSAEAQCRAADPRASAWVSANAGAGKTKVLTDRVVRLLLAGAAPGRILCLTFTKAAAAKMAIRVFERLGRWVTLDDEGLREDLFGLQGKPPARARCASPGACSRAPSRRRAGSRSTPSTPSANAFCISRRSRRTCRRASPCSTKARRGTGRGSDREGPG